MVIRTSEMEVGKISLLTLSVVDLLFYFLQIYLTCVLSFSTKPVHKGDGGLLFGILGSEKPKR